MGEERVGEAESKGQVFGSLLAPQVGLLNQPSPSFRNLLSPLNILPYSQNLIDDNSICSPASIPPPTNIPRTPIVPACFPGISGDFDTSRRVDSRLIYRLRSPRESTTPPPSSLRVASSRELTRLSFSDSLLRRSSSSVRLQSTPPSSCIWLEAESVTALSGRAYRLAGHP